jgi:hypothetical protein
LTLQPAGGLEAAHVEAVLAEVLARPDYLPPAGSLLERGLAAALGWLREHVWARVSGLLPSPDWSSAGWEAALRIALLLGGVLGLALLGYLLFIAVGAFRRRRRRRKGAARSIGEGPRALTAAEWEARSRAAAGRGEWREATLALYHAVLLRLEAADILTVDPSKTPGDYRREARRARPTLGGAFEGFLAGFERIAYGPAGGDGAVQFHELNRAAGELGTHG